jgi:hypothetical protein
MRQAQLLSTNWRSLNGIALSPDERYLYKDARRAPANGTVGMG